MFGTKAYKKIITSFIKNGFTFNRFQAKKNKMNKKRVFLRHDIDFSINEAFKMAMLEYKAGVRATYFFMLSSNMYNLLSETNQNIVKEIQKLGHDISLHFDPTVYIDIDRGFQSEKLMFRNIFNVDVKMVSIHRPGDFLKNNNRRLSGCRHTYEDKFFKKMTYISDSGGKDISEILLELARNTNEICFHLLIHPIWWTRLAHNPTERLNFWLQDQHLFIVEETRRNCKTFQA